ncbi:MAG: hypothetical protein HY744_13855 [Deltaproteobacteria bacterium]|nr:hypothetical protein [Deltaproteobacteria bacterium]
MSEKQIREAIDQVCADLDLRARQRAMRQGLRGALVFPLVLGAGLAVTAACSKDETKPAQDAGVGGAVVLYGAPVGGGGTGGVGGEPQVDYGAPDAGVGGKGGEPVVLYGAPGGGGTGGEGGEPQMDYMAPDAG